MSNTERRTADQQEGAGIEQVRAMVRAAMMLATEVMPMTTDAAKAPLAAAILPLLEARESRATRERTK